MKIVIYTTPSCSSCRKAKRWLDEYDVDYVEKNLFTHSLTEAEINKMLENTENGFDDIISTRSNIFKEHNLDIEDMQIDDLKKFISENPSVLKRPIILGDNKIQIGYNEEEIRAFVPDRLRKLVMNVEYPIGEEGRHQKMINEYLDGVKEKREQELLNKVSFKKKPKK